MGQFELLKLIKQEFKNKPFTYLDIKNKVNLCESSIYVSMRKLQNWGFIVFLERVNKKGLHKSKAVYVLSKKGESVNL